MNDKFDDLKRALQDLADEYNICLFGLAADSFHDMENAGTINFAVSLIILV